MILKLKSNYLVSVVKLNMHALYNLDDFLTLHFSNTTFLTFTKFQKCHFFSIDINGDVVQKLSKKACKLFIKALKCIE